MKKSKPVFCLNIPSEYGEAFIESANNVPTRDIRLIIDYARQALRARISCHISNVLPDQSGEQRLRCKELTLLQHSGGEIDVIHDESPVSLPLEDFSVEDTLAILEELEKQP